MYRPELIYILDIMCILSFPLKLDVEFTFPQIVDLFVISSLNANLDIIVMFVNIGVLI